MCTESYILTNLNTLWPIKKYLESVYYLGSKGVDLKLGLIGFGLDVTYNIIYNIMSNPLLNIHIMGYFKHTPIPAERKILPHT